MPKWLKSNGKPIMDSSGRPFDCPTCPCTTPVPVECAEAVDTEVQAYLDIIDPDTQQHVWTLYGTYEAAYTCAEWAYDDSDSDGVMEWRLVHPASGYLLIALRKGQIVTDTTNCYEEKLVYAKTIYNIATGEYKTIGCQCRVSDHECKHRKTVLDDYLIAGELHVKPYDESDSGESYAPSDACEVDTCELLKLKLTTAQYWHGGTLMSEGYYDWLLAPHDWRYDNYHYQPFKMALKWSVDMSESESSSAEPIYNLTFIDCECSYITTHTLQTGESCLEYAGICTLEDPCIELMLLHNKAMENGWIWHGEGVLAHLAKREYNGTTTYGDWYELRQQYWYSSSEYEEGISYVIRMCAAETPTGYWVMSCGCGTPYYYGKNENTEGYWKYFDLEGVCNCSTSDNDEHSPTRELILSYPDDFGIIDVQYGNDSKFTYEYDTHESDPDEGSYTAHHEGCDVCGYDFEPNQGYGGRTMYIDYRALCWIGKCFDYDATEKVMVRVSYPAGSEGAPYIRNIKRYCSPPMGGSTYTWGIYDDAEFANGYLTPFVHDDDIGYTITYSNGTPPYSRYGFDFKGYGYTWSAGGWIADQYINVCNPTEYCDWSITSREQAESEAGCSDQQPTPCITVNDMNDVNWDKPALLTPDFTVVEHACIVREEVHDYSWVDEDTGEEYHWYESEWCYTHKWWEIGASIGECVWSMLNVHYVRTNEGFIVKGLDGFTESYVLIGAGNYPDYTWCWDDECKHPYVEPWGEVYDPCHWLDKTITCPADLDMHSCLGWTDWGYDDRSDSGSASDSGSL